MRPTSNCTAGSLGIVGRQRSKQVALCSAAILGLCWGLSAGSLVSTAAAGQEAHHRASEPPLAIEIDDLCQHWVRSTEEEPPGGAVQVFRPAVARSFPPSRFRMAYRFARDGSCEWYLLSPDDHHRFKPGTWRIDPADRTLLRIIADEATTSYRIIELSRTLLRLLPMEPTPGR